MGFSRPLRAAYCTGLLLMVAALPLAQHTPAHAAGLVVTTLADNTTANGQCSLREAIINANNDAATHADCAAGTGADTITFSVSGAISLNSALPAITDGDGLLIDGGGVITVDGDERFRVFRVTSSGVADFQNLTITRGEAPTGAGLSVQGVATVTNVTFTNNHAILDGGGIYRNNGKALTVTNSTFTGNIADRGASIYQEGTGSSTTVIGSTFLNNTGVVYSGGVNAHQGTLVVKDSLFKNNTTELDGGGILALGTTTITNTVVEGNTATDPGSVGGGIYLEGTATIENSTIVGNTAGFLGGGVRVYTGTTTIKNSVIKNNTAANGGGISNVAGLVLIETTVEGNTATADGGGIHGTGGDVIRSTISGNTAGSEGGGMHGPLNLYNSTVSGNSANLGGAKASGGGTVVNSTITGNTATTFGGGLSGGVTVKNSVVAGNTAATGADCFPYITGAGPNLVGTLSGCVVTGIPALTNAVLLGPLADNGGPNKTHTLLAGNPALSLGEAAVCAASPIDGVDQRGIVRPQGTGCDLGAVESGLAAPPITGGRDLRITTGSIDLMWTPGATQTDYTLLKYNTTTAAADLIALPAAAFKYSDTTAENGTVYCYVLAATGPSGLLGLSDLVCGLTGQQSGTVIAGNFALTLRQSTNALITWTEPAGGADSYLLVTIPLDGAPPTNLAIPAGATATLRPVISAGTCFQLVAFKGAAFGQTNVLCGVPGVATAGGPAKARTATEALGETAALLGRLPNQRSR